MADLPEESSASGRSISPEYPYVCGKRLHRDGIDRYRSHLDYFEGATRWGLYVQVDARSSSGDGFGGFASIGRTNEDYRVLVAVPHTHQTMHGAAEALQSALLVCLAEATREPAPTAASSPASTRSQHPGLRSAKRTP